MKAMTRFLLALAAALLVAGAANAQDKVVYHIDNSEAQPPRACAISATTWMWPPTRRSSWSPTPKASTS
jgi:hypothetical protein